MEVSFAKQLRDIQSRFEWLGSVGDKLEHDRQVEMDRVAALIPTSDAQELKWRARDRARNLCEFQKARWEYLASFAAILKSASNGMIAQQEEALLELEELRAYQG